jgi:hypothetical protein
VLIQLNGLAIGGPEVGRIIASGRPTAHYPVRRPASYVAPFDTDTPKGNVTMQYLGTILTIIFVLAKLNGTVDWSWWLVLSPAIVTVAVAAFVIVGALFAAVMAAE